MYKLRGIKPQFDLHARPLRQIRRQQNLRLRNDADIAQLLEFALRDGKVDLLLIL